MHFRVFNTFLVAAFVVCSSTRASADGHGNAVHQSRRLPINTSGLQTVPHVDVKFAKKISSDETIDALKQADNNAGAAAKPAKTADGVVGNAGNAYKLSKEDLEEVAKQLSKLSPKKRSKFRTIGLWIGGFLLGIILFAFLKAAF